MQRPFIIINGKIKSIAKQCVSAKSDPFILSKKFYAPKKIDYDFIENCVWCVANKFMRLHFLFGPDIYETYLIIKSDNG